MSTRCKALRSGVRHQLHHVGLLVMSQGFSRKPRTMARRDGTWLYKAVSSETLPGKESRGEAVRGSEQRYSARLKLGLYHEGLAEMGDGLSRRPTAMARQDGAWDDTATSSVTLGGRTSH
jgi:hypothetical protein